MKDHFFFFSMKLYDCLISFKVVNQENSMHIIKYGRHSYLLRFWRLWVRVRQPLFTQLVADLTLECSGDSSFVHCYIPTQKIHSLWPKHLLEWSRCCFRSTLSTRGYNLFGQLVRSASSMFVLSRLKSSKYGLEGITLIKPSLGLDGVFLNKQQR